jgi:hypothetical protein
MAKIGAGHLEGMASKGFKEIGPVFQAFPDSIKSPEEPGVFSNRTPQEVYESKGNESYREYLDRQAREMSDDEPGRERGRERDM